MNKAKKIQLFVIVVLAVVTVLLLLMYTWIVSFFFVAIAVAIYAYYTIAKYGVEHPDRVVICSNSVSIWILKCFLLSQHAEYGNQTF